MENVPGIKDEYNKVILDEFLERLKNNYLVIEDILNAANYGVPQLRKRFVYMLFEKIFIKSLFNAGLNLLCPKLLTLKFQKMDFCPGELFKRLLVICLQ